MLHQTWKVGKAPGGVVSTRKPKSCLVKGGRGSEGACCRRSESPGAEHWTPWCAEEKKKFCLSGGLEELIPRVTKAMEGLSTEDQVSALQNFLWLLCGELDWKGTREGAGRQLSEKR